MFSLFWLKIGGAVALVATAVTFISICHGRGIELGALKSSYAEAVMRNEALVLQLQHSNDRVKSLNETVMSSAARARNAEQAANAQAALWRTERDRITEHLALTISEARNDQSIVTLERCIVPVDAWSRLRNIRSASGDS